MPITVKFQQNEKEIAKAIGQALAVEVDKRLVKVANSAKPKIQNLIRKGLLNSPEIRSLQGGQLQAELGVPDTEERIRSLIDIWAGSVRASLRSAKLQGGFIRAGLDIIAIKSDYSDVLSSSDAIYDTAGGQIIQWLEWLLIEGDKIIIRQYQVGLDVYGVSRTGLGRVMISNQSSSWSVPPNFSGTADNNFVTKALDEIAPEIEQVIISEL